MRGSRPFMWTGTKGQCVRFDQTIGGRTGCVSTGSGRAVVCRPAGCAPRTGGVRKRGSKPAAVITCVQAPSHRSGLQQSTGAWPAQGSADAMGCSGMVIAEWVRAAVEDGATLSAARCAAAISTDATDAPIPFRIRHAARNNRGSRWTKRILPLVYGGLRGTPTPASHPLFDWIQWWGVPVKRLRSRLPAIPRGPFAAIAPADVGRAFLVTSTPTSACWPAAQR